MNGSNVSTTTSPKNNPQNSPKSVIEFHPWNWCRPASSPPCRRRCRGSWLSRRSRAPCPRTSSQRMPGAQFNRNKFDLSFAWNIARASYKLHVLTTKIFLACFQCTEFPAKTEAIICFYLIVSLLLVVEVAVERVALHHGHPRLGQAVRVQVLWQLRLGGVSQEDEIALKTEIVKKENSSPINLKAQKQEAETCMQQKIYRGQVSNAGWRQKTDLKPWYTCTYWLWQPFCLLLPIWQPLSSLRGHFWPRIEIEGPQIPMDPCLWSLWPLFVATSKTLQEGQWIDFVS